MNRGLATIFVLTLGVFGSIACGISSDQACSDFANALCSKYDQCQQDAGTLIRYGNYNTCVTRQKLSCTNANSAPNTGRTAAWVEKCAQAYPNYSCTDFFNNNPPADCQTPPGTVATGSACAFNAQCQTGYCSGARFSACGKCAPAPDAGDDCTVTGSCWYNEQCHTNQTDAGQVVQATCVVWAQSGGTCSNSTPCGAGLSCVGPTWQTSGGTCLSSGTTVGATCDTTQKTAAACDSRYNLFCAKLTSSCQPTTYESASGPCGSFDGGTADGVCTSGGGCFPVVVSAGQQRSCSGPATDGTACDPLNGPTCLPPAKCVTASGWYGTGVCTVVDPTSCK